MTRHVSLLLCGLLLGSLGCGKERLVEAACRADSDCEGGGFLCENYVCIPREAKSCENVVDGNPILQPSPHTVSFGTVDSLDLQKVPVTLHNIGNCTLTIFEAKLSGQDGFACEFCGEGFPKEVFPGREIELELAFQPTQVGKFATKLLLLSDDREYPELTVPVNADFIGVPKLTVAPNPLEYGYVAEGRVSEKTVTLSNQGTGTAPITIEAMTLEPAGILDFSVQGEPALPLTLAPVTVEAMSISSFKVRYHPRSTQAHVGELVLQTNRGELRVPLRGTSETPPKVNVSPLVIDLGNVPLGRSNFQPLTITNEGGAPLKVSYLWGGAMPTTDLYATPTVVPEIQAGAYLEMQVAFTATKVGPVQGLLILTTNDPQKPSITISVTANGTPGTGPEVVKLEMTFENGSDSVFDNDVRNVDMTLEHPYGYVCNKQTPNPMNWGNFGTPSWIAFAPKEEPERVILADAVNDGTYRVMLTYMEDCKSLPTALLAGVLGISVDALITYLTGGVIPIPGGDISQLISQLCLSRGNTPATVRVFVNGNLIKEQTVTLGRKGDSVTALDLVRANSTFSVP